MRLPQTLLITGAGGWLGLNLLERVRELQPTNPSTQVRCLVMNAAGADAASKILPEARVMIGDVRNAANMQRFCEGAAGAALIHTVGIIHPRKVSEFDEVNFRGTSELVSAAIANRVKRVVAVSSNSPCGCNPHPDHLFDENSPYHPYMGYGASKMRMEQFLKEIQKQGKIETVIIRAPWFYGPFHPPRQTLFFEMIRDGKAPIVGSGRNMRSMANVSKLAEGLLLAATVEKANGQIYWIADERPYSMIEIIDTIERLMETEFGIKCAHKRMRLPGIASEVAYFVDMALQKAGLYHQKIHVLSEMNKTIACSVEKAKRELGYQPAQSIEEGMRQSMKVCFGPRVSP